jgi:hypothetical protein
MHLFLFLNNPYSQHLVKHPRCLDATVANPFVEKVSTFADDVGTQKNCPTSFLTSPPFGLFHQQPSNPTAAIIFVYDKPPNLRLPIGYHQLTDTDMHPANHVPVRLFCDIDSMTLIPLNLAQASLYLFLRCGVTQLLTEHSNAPGIPCTRQSNGKLVTVVRLDAQLPAPYMLLQFSWADVLDNGPGIYKVAPTNLAQARMARSRKRRR